MSEMMERSLLPWVRHLGSCALACPWPEGCHFARHTDHDGCSCGLLAAVAALDFDPPAPTRSETEGESNGD